MTASRCDDWAVLNASEAAAHATFSTDHSSHVSDCHYSIAGWRMSRYLRGTWICCWGEMAQGTEWSDNGWVPADHDAIHEDSRRGACYLDSYSGFLELPASPSAWGCMSNTGRLLRGEGAERADPGPGHDLESEEDSGALARDHPLVRKYFSWYS